MINFKQPFLPIWRETVSEHNLPRYMRAMKDIRNDELTK